MAASLSRHPPPLLNPNPNPRSRLRSLPVLRLPPMRHSRSLPRLGLGLRFLPRAGKNGGGETLDVGEVDEERGLSSLPERFRYLTKEAPDPPVRWPWIIALIFLVYAWRAVLWELTNWKVFTFLGLISKLALTSIIISIGNPIIDLITCINISLHYVRLTYTSIVAFAPVPELTRIILFSSAVLSIAEATVPDAVSSQPYLLSLAGIVGLGAVKGFISELPFWLFIAGLFCYSRFIKKRDLVSAALPSAAVLAAVGEPWVRGLSIGSYLGLAFAQNWKSFEGSERRDGRRLPLPLVLVALSIGIHVAAKWVRHRHLTWMIA